MLTSSEGVPFCNSESNPFRGTLKSHGHKIHSLKVSNPGGSAGLFGHMEGASVDVHLVNPTAQGALASAVVANMGSDNQVNATFSGGRVEAEQSGGLMAGKVSGDRNRLNQLGATSEALSVSGGYCSGGGAGHITGTDNKLTQTNLHINIKAGDTSAGGGGCVSDAAGLQLSQENVTMNVAAHRYSGGGFGTVSRAPYTRLTQKNSRLNTTALFIAAAGGVSYLDTSDHVQLRQENVQMFVSGNLWGGGG
ncbi:hypothetical protein, partial [Sansalvadorimonas verongulae]|uniref:hypothetical protein n=1 Tax=Sansalvadorimonas verongulae TaxID=2172824 RepID=UPI001E492EE3